VSGRRKAVAEPGLVSATVAPQLPLTSAETTAETTAETPQSVGSDDLKMIGTALVEFSKVAAGIAALKAKYHGVLYPVSTTQGMQDARDARAAVREPRLDVERIRISAKRPLLDLGRKLDAEAARITAELEAIEAPIAQQIKSEESRKEAERKAKAEAEERRKARILEMIQDLRDLTTLPIGWTAAKIAERLEAARAIEIGAEYQEFSGTAADVLAKSIRALTASLEQRQALEAEQDRIRAEREQLAKERAQQETRAKAEREALAKERAIEEARVAERRRLAEEEQRMAREADAARLAAEREKLAADRKAHEEAQARRKAEEDAKAEEARKEREAQLAEAREKIRKEREEAERLLAERQAKQDAEAQRLADERAQLEREREPVVVEAADPVESYENLGLHSRVETYAEKLLDEIDAAVFSGDTFIGLGARARLRWFMARWERELARWDAENAVEVDTGALT